MLDFDFRNKAIYSKLFFKRSARPRLNEKISQREAIKNSADDVPEGKSTILDAPMCNGGLVSPSSHPL
jgi:hypothetical protein